MNDKIIEIAHLRNRLNLGYFEIEDKNLLDNTEKCISQIDSPFKELSLHSISNCRKDIKRNDLKSAANELRMIHNFPFRNPLAWNSDYFYTIELPSYLENVDDANKIKIFIGLLAKLQINFEKLSEFYKDIF